MSNRGLVNLVHVSRSVGNKDTSRNHGSDIMERNNPHISR